MNITFLFGHDHSRRESELLLKSGDEITSTVSYALKDTDEDSAKGTQTLKFTYGHAGYLTNSIGGHQRYTVLNWTDLRQPDAVISRTLYELDDEGRAATVDGLGTEIDSITAYHFIDPQDEYAWEGDEASGITVKADGELETVFSGVMVDGELIDPENYTAEKGTTVITLNPAYLNALENGTHTLKVLFSNDTGINSDVETTFRVAKKADPSPDPSEPSPDPSEPSPDPSEPSPDPSEPSPDPESGTSQSDTSKGSPRTGDETAVWIWMAVELISLYGIVEGLKKLRKT